MRIVIETLDDLRERCALVPFSGCWLWLHGAIGSGHGYLAKYGLIHRLAFRLANGYEAHGLVCHICDVPLCCNPQHVYDGTKSTNQRDAIARGLAPKPPRRPPALTEEQLHRIARLVSSGKSLRAAAAEAGSYYQATQRAQRRARLSQLMEVCHQVP